MSAAVVKTDEQKVLVRKAFKIAADAHEGTRRKSGEPYILHPLAVAQIVSEEFNLDATSIACALMHDVVEDSDFTLEQMERNFNKDVARIIDGLTKIKGVTSNTSMVKTQAENLKKILLTLSDDVRVILIKIADRLHNMRTMKSMPERKQVRISSETLYLYAPLAHRLGLYKIKTELEDLSLKYTNRELYSEIAQKLAATKRDRDKYIRDFINPLQEKLEEGGLTDFRVYGRPKSIHSIWNKIRKKKVDFEEIYDLFAIRIVIDAPEKKEKAECWKAYSIITDIYKPQPDRLRDWISNPKSNGYESLHTTVLGPKGRWVEVQIRSKQMDEVAEKGVAAHWRYKGQKGASSDVLDNWLEQVRDYLQDPAANPLEFLNDFRQNLYKSDIYVFTPTGDLRTMRGGSTILDFAFSIHTELGAKCIGGKINNKLYPISHKLKNGDQIHILTSTKQKPTEDWLSFTVTTKARSRIKSHLNEAMRIEADNGKMILERKLKQLKAEINKDLIEQLATHFKQGNSLHFLNNISVGKFDLNELKKVTIVNNKIENLVERKARPIEEEKYNDEINQGADLMLFGGLNNVEYSLASCCTPRQGDKVFGFITINKGIKVHRDDCPNAHDLKTKYPYRVASTIWGRQDTVAFLTGLRITGIDDVGLINRLTNVVSNQLSIDMRSISFDTVDGVFEGLIKVYVGNNNELKKLITSIKNIEGVHNVRRIEA
ncbi:UNVERIFIED_CONTAM: hypothetical protein GTU68_059981 [Idotea baltica]|nr:hypothetical protein [Idotea baltica]